MYKCKQGHFTDKEHDGKQCPYDNMSASELSSALVIDTEQKVREKYQEVMSGARSGALDSEGKDKERADKHARKRYLFIRKDKWDVVKIAKYTGFSQYILREIKEYVFNNDKNFTPDFDQAQTWDRLTKGDFVEADLIFLHHEILEMSYIKKGFSYSKAHRLAEKVYNYAIAIEEWKNGNIKKKKDTK
jgi:hypothetical protein